MNIHFYLFQQILGLRKPYARKQVLIKVILIN